MTLRSYLNRLNEQGRIIQVTEPISKIYEIAGVLKKLEPQPVLFLNVRDRKSIQQQS